MWGQIIGGVAGAVIPSLFGRSAERRQQDATNAALAEQRRQFDTLREDQAPWRQAGEAALVPLSQLANQGPMTAEQIMEMDPGYQFGLDEGMRTLQNSQAARGGLFSGQAMRDLTRFGTDYATTRFNDAFNRTQTDMTNRFNRLGSLAGIGQTATNNVGTAGQGFANQFGNLVTGMGNASAANRLAQGNIWGNAINQGFSAWGRSQPNQPRASFGSNLDGFFGGTGGSGD